MSPCCYQWHLVYRPQCYINTHLLSNNDIDQCAWCLQIPWRALGSKHVVVEVSDVWLLAKSRDGPEWEEGPASRRKLAAQEAQLEDHEVIIRHISISTALGNIEYYSASIANAVLHNLIGTDDSRLHVIKILQSVPTSLWSKYSRRIMIHEVS